MAIYDELLAVEHLFLLLAVEVIRDSCCALASRGHENFLCEEALTFWYFEFCDFCNENSYWISLRHRIAAK
jgi:hypothetical protein